MSSSQLRQCPYCHQTWAKGPDYDLRGFAWLDPLPRKVSISNGDCFLHDGAHGRDRFLLFEAKTPFEPAFQAGQHWLLTAAARQVGWTVRILRGRLTDMLLHRVKPDGVDPDGLKVSAKDVRAATSDWLNGQPWQDPRGERVAARPTAHICGYARGADGVWRCAQDYYARGEAPETGCGQTWAAA